ncbi:hypothetical protein PHISCL_08577 [Aspergillus sclerotialis]|uniref:Uncharacterized protein n=1 Tax=Aspergillus sclerotialis TaxID=2070753 RepID=A0A3A2Z7K1_9EURO|nr:hypothetical protein PHISCL_08577 [Aspergillus sclerotialis]
MTTFTVPETGLSLSRDHPGRDSSAKPYQIMRLDLAQNTLDDLIQSLRNDQPARIRLGKHPTLYYGSKSQQFHTSPETHPSEIYSCSSADKENLYFTGVLSHNLEVQKAKEATAATDQALATLEQSLNAFERGKESKQTHIITDIDEVRALKAGDNRSSTGRQAALLARRPTSKVEIEKERLLKNAANRSVSSSPSLGLSRSPNLTPTVIPTSAPLSQSKGQARLEALKVPFIHLLAVRPASVNALAQQTRAPLEDCQTLARKYGTENRDNRDKFDLKDKAFRELDVYKFPYPSQEDRDQAVKHAISAFDRMRISRSDKLWQMLLPKEERGKGKCLSRLDLRTGPIQKPLTPRIQVQPSEDAKDGYTTGHETDKANGNGLTPKSAKATPQFVSTEKKRTGEKDTAKRASTKNKNTNSTLTGRVTKKTERKSAPKPDGKFKSSEYVQDSDDDSDMPDAPTEKPKQETTPQPNPQTKPQPKPQSKPQPKPERKSPGPSSSKATPVPATKANKSEPTSRKSESAQTANKGSAAKRPPSASSNPPRKPSPLGSSPPTNASDVQTHSRSSSTSQTNLSSSSSSPLITQVSRAKQATGAVSNVKKQGDSKPTGVNNSKSTETKNPLKRKAEAERPPTANTQTKTRVNDSENKRRRAVSTSSASTGSASPSLSREVLLQRLREKSQRFKQYYSKYRALYDAMAAHSDPPLAELEKLQKQHARLQRMKKEIWDEDHQLRGRV